MMKRERNDGVPCWTLMLSVILAVVLSQTASGADRREFYVDSRAGLDSGPGNKAQPWQSLDRLSKLEFQPGDRILFVNGSEFEGGFAVSQSGTSNAPITFMAAGEGPPPKFTNPRSVVLDGNAIRIDASYVIVDGLFFERCPSNPVSTHVHKLGAIFLTTNANHNVIRNCEITQTPIGITVYGENNLITRNYIHDNNAPIQPHWGPMCVVICGSHNEVSYNRFENYSAPSAEYGHDGGAIEINDRSLPKEDIAIHHNISLRNQGFIEFVGRVKQDDVRVHHNVCMDYQSFLGLTGPCTNLRVEHNTVVRTLAHAAPDSEEVIFWNYDAGGKYANTNILFRNNIFVYDPSRCEPMFSRAQFHSSHNLYFRTDAASIPKQANQWAFERKYLGGGAQLGPGDKFGDPLFRNLAANDFRLKPGSPAVDAAKPLTYKRDFEDKERLIGSAPDMGAFEFSSDSK
jgi:hypothetical protein